MPGKPVPTKTDDFQSNLKILIAKSGPLIKQGMGKASLTQMRTKYKFKFLEAKHGGTSLTLNFKEEKNTKENWQ